LRGFILKKVQASVVERKKKKFCRPSLSFGKEDTLIKNFCQLEIDHVIDSAAKRNLSNNM
jgi:hypothetical protein